MRKNIAQLVTLFLFSHNVFAAKLVSYCAMDEKGNPITFQSKVKGRVVESEFSYREQERMPIASVSKLFTSMMVLNKYHPEYAFTTVVYFIPIAKTAKGETQYHVHIKGSNDPNYPGASDPYFNQYKMHMIISRLNQAGVKNIAKLTFDENVKYLHDTDSSSGFLVREPIYNSKGTLVRYKKNLIKPLIIKSDLNFPDTQLVKLQLQDTKKILSLYDKKTNTQLASSDEAFYPNPVFQPRQIDYLSSEEFEKNFNQKITELRSQKKTYKLFVRSQDVKTILKSMNWNSNNFAANRMFVNSGGEKSFNDLYYSTFNKAGFNTKNLVFINGSGQNHFEYLNTVSNLEDTSIVDEKNGRAYNEASCLSVMKNTLVLNSRAQYFKINLYDIMSVVGLDIGSTVGGLTYSNFLTKGSVVAKTGTVGTNVSLAGYINTASGPVYFMFNTETKRANNRAEENRARKLISMKLQELARLVIPEQIASYQSKNPLRDSLENFDEDSEQASDAEATVVEPITAQSNAPVVTKM